LWSDPIQPISRGYTHITMEFTENVITQLELEKPMAVTTV